jgi:hypothetical protein
LGYFLLGALSQLIGRLFNQASLEGTLRRLKDVCQGQNLAAHRNCTNNQPRWKAAKVAEKNSFREEKQTL